MTTNTPENVRAAIEELPKDGAGNGSWALDKDGKRIENSYTNHSSFTRFTRDRNWLKLLRPKGWIYSIIEYDNGGGFILGWNCCLKNIQDKLFSSKPDALPTEELAELHAIIQAIEFERNLP